MYAKSDILSNDRSRPPYALKGAVLKEHKRHNPESWLVMVETEKGLLFWTKESNLSATFVPRDLTKKEQEVFDGLSNFLKIKGEAAFRSLYNQVVTDEITKFSIAESKTQWLAMAKMVYSQKFNTQIDG